MEGAYERPGNWSCDLRTKKRPKKLHPMTQSDKHTEMQTDMATLWLNWPSGANSVKKIWYDRNSLIQISIKIRGKWEECSFLNRHSTKYNRQHRKSFIQWGIKTRGKWKGGSFQKDVIVGIRNRGQWEGGSPLKEVSIDQRLDDIGSFTWMD